MVYDISNEPALDREVGESEGYVLVDFFAPWCRPCKIMGPILEKTAEAMDGEVKFCRLNVDEMEEVTERFQLVGVPIFILFKGGEEAGRIVGYNDCQTFQNKLRALMGK